MRATHRPISEHAFESAATAALEKVSSGHLRLTRTAIITIVAIKQRRISAQKVNTFAFDLAILVSSQVISTLLLVWLSLTTGPIRGDLKCDAWLHLRKKGGEKFVIQLSCPASVAPAADTLPTSMS